MAPIDPYPPFEPVQICEPLFASSDIRRQRAGVWAFSRMVLDEWGGRDLGVGRQCTGEPTSRHHESRAWDWGPAKGELLAAWQARAAALVSQLLAEGPAGPHELARRFGIRNIIFDGKHFGARDLYEPRDYEGQSPHTDHIHFDFSWAGAKGETSGYESRGGVPAVAFPFLAMAAITSAVALLLWLTARAST